MSRRLNEKYLGTNRLFYFYQSQQSLKFDQPRKPAYNSYKLKNTSLENNFCFVSGFGMQSSESKGRRAAAQSAQSEGSSSSELEDQIEKDRYLSAVSFPIYY